MNLFKSGTLAWWQVGILKLSVACIAIAIGANWPQIFQPLTLWLVIVGVLLGLYLVSVWYKK
jgi:hypothetical protein